VGNDPDICNIRTGTDQVSGYTPAPQRRQATRVLDHEFAQWVRKRFCQDCDEEQAASVECLAKAVSHALNLKHSCLDLHRYPALHDQVLNELLDGFTPEQVRDLGGDSLGTEGSAAKLVPLVCSADGSLIWLQKYHVLSRVSPA